MTFGLKTTVIGPAISPNLGLKQSQSDDVDDAAIAFGSRLLLRIDPRDIRRTTDNPTGKKRVHYMAPNRDPALFTGSGISVGPISGKYNGRDVFGMTRTGTAAANTNNDFKVGPKSLNGITEFSVFGVAHFDAGLLGQSDLHPLIGMYRDRSTLEAAIIFQYSGGVNYLSIYADQGDGGGENHTLDGSTVFTAGVPFFYFFRVKVPHSMLCINRLDTAVLNQVASSTMEAGNIEVYLGHLTTDAQQWAGGHGRAYVISGDALDTDDNAALSQALMLEMKAYYGIA